MAFQYRFLFDECLCLALSDIANSLVDIDRDGHISITEWPPERRNDAL